MNIRLIGVFCACSIAIVSSAVQAVPVSGQGTWETTLQGRDLDGNAATFEAYYDTILGITWLADANYAQTSGFDTDGRMAWANANAWATNLNINGVTGWRLPTLGPINGTSFITTFSNNATTDLGNAGSVGWVDGGGNPVSEIGYMYYVNLGNLGRCTPDNGNPGGCTLQPNWGLTNTGPFTNIQLDNYWSDTEFTSSPSSAWSFISSRGTQTMNFKVNNLFAWAVRPGDVSGVPIPAAVWLFGSGFIALVGIARCKKAA